MVQPDPRLHEWQIHSWTVVHCLPEVPKNAYVPVRSRTEGRVNHIAPRDDAQAVSTNPAVGGSDAAARDQRAKRWQDDNAAGFEAWNDYVERNGVPLAQFRKF